MNSRDKLLLRFWSKVDMLDDDDCWDWTAGLQAGGYGGFQHSGKSWKAHRLAWEFENGPIPEGKHILHSCDNRICCNPKHLRPGTQKDNMRDMHKRGRNIGNRGQSQSKETRDKIAKTLKGRVNAFLIEEECVRSISQDEFHALKADGLAYGMTHKLTQKFLKRKK